MQNRDKIEYYDGDRIVASVESSMVPTVGSRISIRKKTWSVVRVTFALDHADEPMEKGMRANVEIEAC